MLLAWGLMLAVASTPYKANIDTFAWTTTDNTMYYTLSRPLFVLGLVMFLIPIMFGMFSKCMSACGHRHCRPLSKINYLVYLFYPAVILTIYASQEEPLYLSYPMVVVFLLGHIFIAYFIGFILFIVVEGPIKHIVQRVGEHITHFKRTNKEIFA